MGISTVVSYRARSCSEAVGLADEVVDYVFRVWPAAIQGASFSDLQAEQSLLAKKAGTPRRISAGACSVRVWR